MSHIGLHSLTSDDLIKARVILHLNVLHQHVVRANGIAQKARLLPYMLDVLQAVDENRAIAMFVHAAARRAAIAH